MNVWMYEWMNVYDEFSERMNSGYLWRQFHGQIFSTNNLLGVRWNQSKTGRGSGKTLAFAFWISLEIFFMILCFEKMAKPIGFIFDASCPRSCHIRLPFSLSFFFLFSRPFLNLCIFHHHFSWVISWLFSLFFSFPLLFLFLFLLLFLFLSPFATRTGIINGKFKIVFSIDLSAIMGFHQQNVSTKWWLQLQDYLMLWTPSGKRRLWIRSFENDNFSMYKDEILKNKD